MPTRQICKTENAFEATDLARLLSFRGWIPACFGMRPTKPVPLWFPGHANCRSAYLGKSHGTQQLKLAFCCCCSVAQSSPPLRNPMDHFTPGSPVFRHPPEFA
ncbi:UNVERIFIED_CONTAM: hypothetical protein K2H54_070621 [Gekko kuhli]